MPATRATLASSLAGRAHGALLRRLIARWYQSALPPSFQVTCRK